jgi:hypothetical protein
MGSDAQVFVFDDARLREEVVPDLVRLLRTGVPDGWLAELIERVEGQAGWDEGWRSLLLPHLRARPTDLARHCTWLGPDMRLVGDELARAERRHDWRPCPSGTCQERHQCPLHEGTDLGLNEAFNGLFEAGVAERCLGPSQFVGRSWSSVQYLDLLDELGMAAGDPLRELLWALELRGGAIGYRFADGDGIHGWLTAEETADLAGRLAALPLPGYAPTFETMRGFGGPTGGGPYELPGWTWPALSLSFVRTVATIAARDGKGVLWGNDVGPL